MKKRLIGLLTAGLMLIQFHPGRALDGNIRAVEARLITEYKAIRPGKTFWVGLYLKIRRGWHVYWRNPGAAGEPVSLIWELPDGFTAGELNWPVPERIQVEDLVNYGYSDEILLPVKIEPPRNIRPGERVLLKAVAKWLACEYECVPDSAQLQILLPIAAASDPVSATRWKSLFDRTRRNLPLKTSSWEFRAILSNGSVKIDMSPPEQFDGDLQDLDFFPYENGIFDCSKKPFLVRNAEKYVLIISLLEERFSDPVRIRGILVFNAGWDDSHMRRAVEIDLPIIANASTNAAQKVFLALFFAFLGGLILNLMPCVLPVLSIKVMGLINHARDEQVQPWKHGVAFTLGVLVAFWVLAGILLALKAGGTQLGWGFQLQSPRFIVLLSYLFFLFALSLFRVFEIGTSLTALGGVSSGFRGLTASFVSGGIATVVATPCTAPFMGTALGYALTQPAWIGILVFTFLGLGMAAPFFLVSSAPALMRFIPKPGRWMESLEQFMGFLLMATVLWLLWVLGIQAGLTVLLLVLGGLLCAALGGWIYGRWGTIAVPLKIRLIARVLAFLIVAGSAGYILAQIDRYAVSAGSTGQTASQGIHWLPYSEEKLQQLLRKNKPVFIDFTAAWCLSCQANEKVAFSSAEVQKAFRDMGIVALRADWTSRDEAIARALARYGRHSVPLYVFYPGKPGAKPVILPQILTPGIVLETIQACQ